MQLVAFQGTTPNSSMMSDGVSVAFADHHEESLTLENVEAATLSNNPTLVQAMAQVKAARAAAYQAGLSLNPVVGYEGQIDSPDGGSDENWNGGFVSQEIVTGGKLRLSRTKWCERVGIAETNLQAQQQRVLNDVRIQFFRTLAAQQQVDIARALVANGEDNLQTHREMLNLGQTNQAGLLRAEVDLQRDRLRLKQAEFEMDHAWRSLTAMMGLPQLEMTQLSGQLAVEEVPLDWETAWGNIASASPEIQAALQKIRHDEVTVQREQAEPIPNLIASVSSIRSPIANTTETVFSVGLPLPLFDRNQGTIRQAQADLMQSHAEAQRLELDLMNRLAAKYRDYQTAWHNVAEYQEVMLPKARQAYDLLHESYKKRRAAWPDVLMAQRYFLNLQAEQVANLVAYHENDIAIRGMLLSGGLSTPSAPVGAGHIDAVPKPR